MAPLRFSELSAPRQVFIRQCQRIDFGRIVGLLVRDSEPVFVEQTEIFLDLKLDADDNPRPEEHLSDFTLCAELTRLFAKLDAIRNSFIEHVEVRAGIPRRIVFKASNLMDR